MIAVALGLAPAALAHPQASPDTNNRYLKLTPMGDRVRVAYTIFLGEKPGAALRRRLDRDRNGEIDDAEAAPYGEEIAALVKLAVSVTIDGRPTSIAWTTVDVGLGTPSVVGGAFSVDLVGWLCTSGPSHRLVLRDTVRLDRPGESEVKIEDGPGVLIGARTLGGQAMDKLDQLWTGADGPLTEGLDLSWTVDDAAARPADGRCHDARPKGSRWPWAKATLALIALAAIAMVAWKARQRKVNG